ncbi:MAG: hypothetical protein MRJ92_07155 [Nitrospira sp.]|nr:hypothetical protein [Nitrospira sp.]
MQRGQSKRALLVMIGLSLAACVSPLSGGSAPMTATSAGKVVAVQPRETDDVLYNPGMGFADFI